LFISGLSLDVLRFAKAARSHWAIENNLHWVLDVSFREDQNRSRKDHTAENLAWARRLTVSLFAKDGTKVGVRCKGKRPAGTTSPCSPSPATPSREPFFCPE
jgi:hypothetical protein